jgi:hypothetical protein
MKIKNLCRHFLQTDRKAFRGQRRSPRAGLPACASHVGVLPTVARSKKRIKCSCNWAYRSWLFSK